jgi:CheY-like chemotaxis protein
LSPQILGDSSRLQQILLNLLTNAIKFTPERGRVTVQLTRVEAQVQLCVQDTGKGIDSEFLPRVFERFQQGQNNTGSKDGLGLGLAIVKSLVELHNGTITADSPGVDQGATFTVQFPLLSTPAILPGRSSSIALDAASLSGIRILVVDDEQDQLDLIAFVLEEAGAEVQPATSAIVAINKLIQFQPDVLVTDLAMPEGNGYELLQQVRLQPQGNIPAIVLTAYASTTHAEQSLQAGFQSHLTKPVEPEGLVAAIISALRGRH